MKLKEYTGQMSQYSKLCEKLSVSNAIRHYHGTTSDSSPGIPNPSRFRQSQILGSVASKSGYFGIIQNFLAKIFYYFSVQSLSYRKFVQKCRYW